MVTVRGSGGDELEAQADLNPSSPPSSSPARPLPTLAFCLLLGWPLVQAVLLAHGPAEDFRICRPVLGAHPRSRARRQLPLRPLPPQLPAPSRHRPLSEIRVEDTRQDRLLDPPEVETGEGTRSRERPRSPRRMTPRPARTSRSTRTDSHHNRTTTTTTERHTHGVRGSTRSLKGTRSRE